MPLPISSPVQTPPQPTQIVAESTELLGPTLTPETPADAAPTLTAVSYIAASTTPTGDHVESPYEVPSAVIDACTLLTEEEAEAATGLQLNKVIDLAATTPGAKCRYDAEGTSVALKVFAPIDEAQAARVWKGRYFLYSNEKMSTFFEFRPGIGDAAFVYEQASSAGDLVTDKFWYIIVKEGETYLELLWLTNETDPSGPLAEMASKIVSRLRSQ